ncbi:hypothetical protein NQ314_002655 [Rhamnusium bicolor]|uniref:Tyr recombinase domain-containing protein n=1 Tax=Rhamnusium bicolor TaxID=1586634 RepID=A0AAV8ZNN6_9CUCU|nr:hypothetical protein NQ314_002655 [Rhamnusium bicolor]
MTIAAENRTQHQRIKLVVLPLTEDVKKLRCSLHYELQRCLSKLESGFDLDTWAMLSKVTLINIMIFNRKRPGDVEKSQIIEYQNLQMVEEDVLEKLDNSQKKYATMFGRYISRGKLDSPAPVLVSKTDMFAIEQILKYRQNANIDEKNPYLFAAPPRSSNAYYKVGRALNDFCYSQGLENKNLTATKLRKHLATVTCTLEKAEQAVISDFMGHALNIHNKIYRQRPVFRDVVQMVKVLTNAIGMNEDNIDCFDQHETRTQPLQLLQPQKERNETVSTTECDEPTHCHQTTNEIQAQLYTPEQSVKKNVWTGIMIITTNQNYQQF